MRKKYENLHTHTVASDGKLSYQEALDLCAENNIGIVAFTDHDSLPNEKALKILQKNRQHPTKWIIGIEISSGWPKEIGGPASNFHIVGLFVDPTNQALKKHCKKAMAGRIERMNKIVSNLQSFGFNISEQDCKKESGGETICRPHIIAALKKRNENIKIIEQLKNKMAEEAVNNPEIKRDYEDMIASGEKQYPYSLLLGKHAFVSGIYVDYLYWKDMDKSVELIRSAGGIAILAHWTFSKRTVNYEMIKKFFQEKRLDGGEIVFGLDSQENLKNKQMIKDMETMEKLTKECGVLQSGGGDSHAKEDFERFGKSKWLAEKTIGMVEKMQKQKKLNIKFSSI